MSDIREAVAAAFQRIRDRQQEVAGELAEDHQLDCKTCNPILVKKQGLVQADIDAIAELHVVMNRLFEHMSELDPTDRELKECVATLQCIEFGMQRAWKFEEDVNYHTWWMRAPHCICPRMDNMDMAFFGRGPILQQDCPLHGWDEAE